MTLNFNKLLQNNWFTISFKKNLGYNLHPETISEKTANQFLLDTSKIITIFLTFYIAVNLLFSLFNLDHLIQYGEVMKKFYNEGKISWSLYIMNVFPYSVLFLACFFLTLQLVNTSISYGAMWILGEPTRSFPKLLGIYLSSSLYILLSLFPVLVLFQLISKSAQDDFYKMIFFIALNAAILLIGIVLQSFFFIKMCKNAFDQNVGRAILTWLSPLLLIILFVISSFG
ncbi:hypothetical protein DLM77_15215 [Leptospira yasudae]|uniref:Yip1 domain-containing protein n=1 Tax=Leptospira yasudae TaxID=2202201 RepID=A0ABX9LZS9_9LEPT|nr:hypothetical protein DLM77_15215 [Leptospira yasudae]